MRTDIAALKARHDIVDVISKRVSLRKKGSEWVGICPFHDDHRSSLQVNPSKQVFACFACGKAGDVIDFLVDMGATFQEAVTELSGGETSDKTPTKRKIEKAAKPVTWTMVSEAPQPGQIVHYKHGAPSRTWAYKGQDGHLMGLICRFDTPDGKEVLPYTYRTDGSRKEWRWQGFDVPRPLYNLDQIAARPDTTVLIVEGEKTADAAQTLLPHIVVTCWQGGAKAIKNTDWTPLHGRKIVLWPDNDNPGIEAMQEINHNLRTHCSVIKWIRNSPEFPEKWDIADAEWTPDQALAYIRANMIDVPAQSADQEPMPDEPEYIQPPEDLQYTPPPADFADQFTPPTFDEAPFKVLGFMKEQGKMLYAFFTSDNNQVHVMKSGELSGNNLLALAPLDWWEANYPKKSPGKFATEAAVNAIIREAHAKGIFNPKYLRGRGAWMDRGRVVIHVGDRLIVDGIDVALGELDTRFIYQMDDPLSFPTHNPLSTKEANRLMEIMGLCNWERQVNAHLLAGWCVIAPICGALNWRPHIWITGAAGTGKSWVFKHVVRALLGKSALAVQAETSEAGIRQTLTNDAIPIVFDEAEGEDRRARERMEAVLALMRASSAEDGGVMLKGTAGGKAQMFRIRSCFAFASIGVQITQQSDRGRVTILGLTRPIDRIRNDRWQKLKALYMEVFTSDFVPRLQARTVSLIPVILDNAETFSKAVAFELGEQRAGDQLGVLLAGAYSLYSSNKITMEAAVEFVKSQNWDEEKSLDVTRDEHALMAKLMDHIVKVDGPNVERTVGELLMLAGHEIFDENVSSKTASDRLLRYGFKIEGEHFIVSTSNSYISAILKDTPWVKSIGRTLSRIDGAQQIASARFGPGQITRAVKIPMRWLKE